MLASSTGSNRVAIFAGGIGAFVWFAYVFVESDGFSRLNSSHLFFILSVGGPASSYPSYLCVPLRGSLRVSGNKETDPFLLHRLPSRDRSPSG